MVRQHPTADSEARRWSSRLAPLRDLFRGSFGSLWLIVFLIGVVSAPVQSLFAVYVEATLHRSTGFSSNIRAVYLVLGGLFAIPGGALCDRIGVKRTYALGLTGSVAAGALFLTGDPFWLLALSLYAGAAFGLSTTGGQSYLIASVPPASLGLGSAVYFIGSTLGNSVGNSFSGKIADQMGFHTLGLWMVLATAAITLGTAVFLPVPSREGRRGAEKGEIRTRFRDILKRREVLLLMALRFLPTFYWGVATFLIPLLIFRAVGTKNAAAQYSAVSLVIAAVFQILTGRLCDRFGRRRPMVVAACLVALSAGLLAVFSHSLVGLYVCGILGAASAWSLSTTMPSLIADVSGPGEKGRVLGATHFCWSAGNYSGTRLAGVLAERSTALAFSAGAAAALLAAITATALYVALRPDRMK